MSDVVSRIIGTIFSLVLFALSLYGVILGFYESILMGILMIIITPLSTVTGFAMFAFDVNLATIIANLIADIF